MLRVLYVDDDRVNSLLFVEACRFAGGVEVETAATAAEALELVRHWTPELLVIDLHLPDLDGYAVAARPAGPPGRAAAGLPVHGRRGTASRARRARRASTAAGASRWT